ncbi:MAG: UbiA family prenyltransferase [Euryarchaeota archaeon]|nr:UbiA family prenyltransferase [Euryarchaeota archaeon]
MSKAKALLELTRLEHGLMLAIGVAVGALVASGAFPPADKFALTFLTALLLEASTFALNDYFDYDIDVRNRRADRPLVRGELSRRTALVVFAALFPLGIVCSFFVNMTCFLIALLTAILAVVYDAVLKRQKLVGNFYIAYTMAIPFVFGAAAVQQGGGLSLGLSRPIIVIALIAFLSGTGREIMKDVQDVEGDRAVGVRSFATALGTRGALGFSSVFYLAAIAFSLLPFLEASFAQYYLDYYYLMVVLVTDAMLAFTGISMASRKAPNLRTHRALTLVAMFIGLIAFLVGAFH